MKGLHYNVEAMKPELIIRACNTFIFNIEKLVLLG